MYRAAPTASNATSAGLSFRSATEVVDGLDTGIKGNNLPLFEFAAQDQLNVLEFLILCDFKGSRVGIERCRLINSLRPDATSPK